MQKFRPKYTQNALFLRKKVKSRCRAGVFTPKSNRSHLHLLCQTILSKGHVLSPFNLCFIFAVSVFISAIISAVFLFALLPTINVPLVACMHLSALAFSSSSRCSFTVQCAFERISHP